MEYKFSFSYLANGSYKTASGENDDFSLNVQESENGLKVVLEPKTDIRINSFFATRDYDFAEDAKFFANGFQSWTDSREFTKSERMPGLGLVGKSLFGKIFGLNNEIGRAHV